MLYHIVAELALASKTILKEYVYADARGLTSIIGFRIIVLMSSDLL